MVSLAEEISLEVCEDSDAAQLLLIEEGLNEFNNLMTGINNRKPLSVLVNQPARVRYLAECKGGHRWDSCL